jgi:hypothetical protein
MSIKNSLYGTGGNMTDFLTQSGKNMIENVLRKHSDILQNIGGLFRGK